MKAARSVRPNLGFTLVELLAVCVIVGILASLLLPAMNQGKARAKRVGCINHLRQIGIAFQDFAHDHNSLFPMAVPASAGGSQEFAVPAYQVAGQFLFSFHHFQAISNSLVTPAILACPSDTRKPVASFISFNNKNLSYLVGLRADCARPYSVLAGDRNLTNECSTDPVPLRQQSNGGWRWTSELHQFKGNLLFADAHVEEKNSRGLSSALDHSGELALPDTSHTITSAGSVSGPSAAAPGKVNEFSSRRGTRFSASTWPMGKP